MTLRVGQLTGFGIDHSFNQAPPGGGGGSFTTWNPDDKTANLTLTNGNLTADDSAQTNSYQGVRSISAKASGKWYWEVNVDLLEAGNGDYYAGFASAAKTMGVNPATDDGTFVIWRGTGSVSKSSDVTSASADFGAGQGHYRMFALDIDNGNMWVGADGTWSFSGDPGNLASPLASGIPAGTYYAFWTSDNSTGIARCTADFGDQGFQGTVPNGFTGWTTASDAGGQTWDLTAIDLSGNTVWGFSASASYFFSSNLGGFITGVVGGSVSPTTQQGANIAAIFASTGASGLEFVVAIEGTTLPQSYFTSITINGNTYTTASADEFQQDPFGSGICIWNWTTTAFTGAGNLTVSFDPATT